MIYCTSLKEQVQAEDVAGPDVCSLAKGPSCKEGSVEEENSFFSFECFYERIALTDQHQSPACAIFSFLHGV